MASQDKLRCQATLSRVDEARRIAFNISTKPRTVIDFAAPMREVA